MDDIKIGRYHHFKGNEYQVLYIAKHSETLEPMVVYQALYGERGIWENGKPKKWYYALPIVLLWLLVLWLIVKAFL